MDMSITQYCEPVGCTLQYQGGMKLIEEKVELQHEVLHRPNGCVVHHILEQMDSQHRVYLDEVGPVG